MLNNLLKFVRGFLIEYMKKVGGLVFIIFTLFLFWIFIKGPEGEILDFSIFIRTIYRFEFAFSLFLLLISIIIIFLRNRIIVVLPNILNYLGLLNKCSYCEMIRHDNESYLVNGYCKNCKTHICSVCFNHVDKKEKKAPGCPNSCANLNSDRNFYYQIYLYKLFNIPKYHSP